ncbi:ChaC-like protein [Roseivivax sp. THAF40]|uniref:gamma-glutamylcyclotransferase n=1 Tax=unclassified Roseivivax TaxID=2639302 RepID=UPI0012694565|nr:MULTISPECIES: gamma-glutamylcyclotransferase [unclassified Roseivivax]QFS84303.1 ChaC-like protein [Roseivivax sp. THAF197b]QFT48131.1 ChaC-like protein [Roseivivax sp. THAF40]
MTLWVFGYGSLLWNPGFEVIERVPARLSGYRRSFCMRSIHHRGTEEAPGLVLALDAEEGGACDGLALAAHPDQADAVLAYLRERELVSAAYLERLLPLSLNDGREVTALAYVIDPDHTQYCLLDLEEQARIIAGAVGGRGPNTEYLFNTAQHLEELGIPDAELQWLDQRVRELTA